MEKKKRRILLSEKLVVYFVFFGIAGLIVVEIFAFHHSGRAILNRTFDQLTSVRKVKSHLIEGFLRDRLLDAQLVAGSDLYNPTDNDHFVVSKLSNSGYYLWMAVSGKNNELTVYPMNDLEATSHVLRDNFSEPYSLEFIRQKTVNKRVPVIHDLVSTDKLAGNMLVVSAGFQGMDSVIVLLAIDYDVINQIMLEKSAADGLGESGESYLVGPDNLMRTRSRFVNLPEGPISVNTIAMDEAVKGNFNTRAILDYRDVKVLSSWGRIEAPGLDWVIIAEINYAEALAPVNSLRNGLLLIGLIITMIIFLFAYFFSRHLTFPVIRLNEAARLIRDGHRDVKLKIRSNDEIGELTSSFNEMAAQLKMQEETIALEKKRRLRSLFDGQEQERQRLSRELHDGLGQALVGIKMQIEGVHRKSIEETEIQLEKTKDYLNQTIEEIRRMSNKLAPGGLLEFGLVASVRNLCYTIQEQSGCTIVFSSVGEIKPISKRNMIYIYRMVQEALNNDCQTFWLHPYLLLS